MNEQAPPMTTPKSSGGCGKIAIGCGIALLVLVIILAVAGWFVVKNWKSWTASLVSAGVTEVVEQSQMSDEQKRAIISRVDQFTQDFAAGRITAEQVARAMENLDVEALVAAGVAQYVGSGLIQSAGLSEQERETGKRALDRVAHGLMDGQVSMQDLEQALAPITVQTGGSSWELKPSPTPEELKQVMDNATDLADQAGVPEDVGEVDFASRVNEAFDQALGAPQP